MYVLTRKGGGERRVEERRMGRGGERKGREREGREKKGGRRGEGGRGKKGGRKGGKVSWYSHIIMSSHHPVFENANECLPTCR